jgi:hypothetical protein
MTFTRDPTLHDKWDISFEDKQQYAKDRRALQAQRLITGGARLAATLNSVWPSKKVAPACK